MNETLAEIVPKLVDSLLRGAHTALPGKIDKYDRGTFRADVTPLLSSYTRNGKEIKIPPILDVPVMVFGGSNGIVDIELTKGDNVILIFMESGIGGWKSSKGDKQVSPDDFSHHALKDAVAIPCLVPDGIDLSQAPRIKIDKDGTMAMVNDNGHITLSSNGQVNCNDNFTVDP